MRPSGRRSGERQREKKEKHAELSRAPTISITKEALRWRHGPPPPPPPLGIGEELVSTAPLIHPHQPPSTSSSSFSSTYSSSSSSSLSFSTPSSSPLLLLFPLPPPSPPPPRLPPPPLLLHYLLFLFLLLLDQGYIRYRDQRGGDNEDENCGKAPTHEACVVRSVCCWSFSKSREWKKQQHV